MTDRDTYIWNLAILKACEEYKNGYGAIRSLYKPVEVAVEHIGTQTKQEVVIKDE